VERPERPTVRRMGIDFGGLPKHWFFGHPVHTAVVNALSLLFPAGERFFIRSVKYFESEISDPTLKAAMRAFYGQEAHHQKEHLAANAALEAQGFELDSFLGWWERVAFGLVEPRFPPNVRLAATAAAEHFTATLAEIALRDRVLEAAHPSMQELLFWHAAEEIEHKSVAFDVLQTIDPRYRTRVYGFVVVSAVLALGWAVGVRHLLRQDGSPRPPLPAQVRERLPRVLGKVAKSLAAYLKPGFHPEQQDNRRLAREYLSRIGRLAG
jgi:predicted metal-dependent hydrolase